MKRKALGLGLGTLCSLLVFSPRTFGQGLATLQGSVSDPSGAVVAAAKIAVTQTGTGLTRSATTDSQGNYLVPALQPANYTLTVEAAGFRQLTRKDITLQADQSATVNVTMELGQATQNVTVEAAAILVDTVTGTQKGVINTTQMVELPLNGRNAAQLSFLVPGAQQSIAGGGRQGVAEAC